jgi:hypothetical protein
MAGRLFLRNRYQKRPALSVSRGSDSKRQVMPTLLKRMEWSSVSGQCRYSRNALTPDSSR